MRFVPFNSHHIGTHRSDTPRLLVAAVSILIGVAVASPSFAQLARADDSAIQQFQRAVDAYVQLHRQIEQTLEPLTVTADAAILQRAIDARADAMRRARPEPRQGDLFTPAVAKVLRVRIARALSAHGLTAADVLIEELAEGNDDLPATMRVNGPFPWHAATGMLLCLTDVLPELPDELQYRLVGRDLVLIDLPASLVVDILPRALADPKSTTKVRF